jgi:hypothetical protein
MPNRAFREIVTRLAPSVPGAPNVVVEQYVRDAAIEACERTLAWRYEQPQIRLNPGGHDYAYDPPDFSEVHAILTATVNGEKLAPISLEQLHDVYPKWPYVSSNEHATPRYITSIDPDNFAVAPVPDANVIYDVRMIVALKPLRTAEEMDKTALDDLENVIMHGALQHLLVLPDRTWSDRELASYHAKQFAYKLSERRARANLGTGRGSMRVQNQRFA